MSISRQTITGGVNQGRATCFRIGRSWLLKSEDQDPRLILAWNTDEITRPKLLLAFSIPLSAQLRGVSYRE